MELGSAGATPAGNAWVLDPERRRAVRWCTSALAVMGTASLVGVASSLYLVNHAPLLLVALSPIGRHLWLVAPSVDPLAFVAVVVVRRMLFYLASFHLGRALGPAGVTWLEQRAAHFGRFVRWLERLFARAAHAIVFFFSGPTVSALAGASGMPARRFAALAAPGLVLRAVLVLGIAAQVRPQLEAVLAWIDAHWLPGTAVMLVAVALYGWRHRSPSPHMET